MNESRLVSLEQVRAFLAGTNAVQLTPLQEEERYPHIERVLSRFAYGTLKKPGKGLIRGYLMRTTGYSRQQLTRLIGRWVNGKRLKKAYKPPCCGLPKRFTEADVALLAETDALHQTLSGPATRQLMRRAWEEYGDVRYEQLASISVAHLYNLRKRSGYLARRTHWTKTHRSAVPIGARRAPAPNGQPGYIRIDSVHQGDLDKVKGVYHINAVDCVTQWELVATCERISEAYLLPVIQALLEAFPFKILGFHADNGSEYINTHVAKLLEKLRAEFTKSRPRHSNDNALVETKNGAVVRKILGYSHIPQHHARRLNLFCHDYLNPYVNFHRPCHFAVEECDAKGKIRKRYPLAQIKTPCEKLLSISEVERYLKPGVTIESLREQARQMSDNEAAKRMVDARYRLFLAIDQRSKSVA